MKTNIILLFVAVFSTLLVWFKVKSQIIYENFDGPYYGVVAVCGYDRDCIRHKFSFDLPVEYYAAHFPLYPAIVRLLSYFTSGEIMLALILTSLLGTILLAFSINSIWGKMNWKFGFETALATLFFWPRMWGVRSVGSPETLFITAIIWSLYYCYKKSISLVQFLES